MKHVRAHIDERAQHLATRPLFAYLRDEAIDPRRRLQFIPFMAHFVMTFADLYDFVLPVKPPRDWYEQLVNTHVAEDATHWKWFLADLTQADFDTSLPFTNALRLLWGKTTVRTRHLSYEICKCAGRMNSLQKLIMVQCIEAGGRVALEAVAVAGRSLEGKVARRLIYFGSHHSETENHHTLEDRAIRDSLEQIVLKTPERTDLCATVDHIFAYLTGFVDEMFDIAQSGCDLTEHAVATRKPIC